MAAEMVEALKTRESISWSRLHPMEMFRSLPELVDGLCASPQVKCLKVFERVLRDGDATEIARLLRNHSSLARLEFASCEMSDEGVAIIAEALAQNSTLTAVGFGASSSDEAAMLSVFRSLRNHASVRSVTFTMFEGIRAEHVAGVFGASATLASLFFDNCALGDDETALICASLAGCPSLRTLHLEAAGIGDRGALALANLLAASRSLEEINLSGNSITDAGIMPIVEAAMRSSKLRRLDLSRNPLTDDGARVFASLLTGTSSRTIDASADAIANDALTTGGAIAVPAASFSSPSAAFSSSASLPFAPAPGTALESLVLECRSLSAAGASHIFSALRGNSALTSLSVQWGLRSDHPWGKDLREALEANGTLKRLRIAPESWNATQTAHLAPGLLTNETLLSFLPMFRLRSPQACEMLCAAARYSSTLVIGEEVGDLSAVDAPNVSLNTAVAAVRAQGGDLLLRAFARFSHSPGSIFPSFVSSSSLAPAAVDLLASAPNPVPTPTPVEQSSLPGGGDDKSSFVAAKVCVFALPHAEALAGTRDNRARVRVLVVDLAGQVLLDACVEDDGAISASAAVLPFNALARPAADVPMPALATRAAAACGGDDGASGGDAPAGDAIIARGGMMAAFRTKAGDAYALDFSVLDAAHAAGVDTATGLFADMDLARLANRCQSKARRFAFMTKCPAAVRRLASLAAVHLHDSDADSLFVEYLAPSIRSHLAEVEGEHYK
jgi:hypothetical protein